MSYDLDMAVAIAADTRLWAEDYAAERRGEYDLDLCGLCAIASAELYRKLKVAGITSEIHMWAEENGDSHVFIVVDDHVIDVTATQFREFSNEPVVVMHKREAEAFPFYRTDHVYHSDKTLVRSQRKQGWPASQIAKLAA